MSTVDFAYKCYQSKMQLQFTSLNDVYNYRNGNIIQLKFTSK